MPPKHKPRRDLRPGGQACGGAFGARTPRREGATIGVSGPNWVRFSEKNGAEFAESIEFTVDTPF